MWLLPPEACSSPVAGRFFRVYTDLVARSPWRRQQDRHTHRIHTLSKRRPRRLSAGGKVREPGESGDVDKG